ncbi:MAG: GreA/GreB family elongation factor [Bacteroidota bacterium]
MSRAFVNEDDQREAPFVPPRADLPDGVPNYVTPEGMALLLQEKEALQAELRSLTSGDQPDKQNEISVVNTRLLMLNNRISSAQVIHHEKMSSGEVSFGSLITIRFRGVATEQKFRIVGVDEADLKKGKMAFTSPLARLLMHKKAGDSAVLKTAGGERVIEIMAVE